jgi:hypothetical protein
MVSLAEGAHETAKTELRLDEGLFGRGEFEKLTDAADLPTSPQESFSLSFIHGVSSFLKAANRRRQFVIVFWGVVFVFFSKTSRIPMASLPTQ